MMPKWGGTHIGAEYTRIAWDELQAEGEGAHRVVRDIPLGAIQMDRHSLSPATLSLVDHLRRGGEVPPIHVARLPSGGYRICDGRHRVTAAKLLGHRTITARFSTALLRSNP